MEMQTNNPELLLQKIKPEEKLEETEMFLGISNFNKSTEIFSPKDSLIYQKTNSGKKNNSCYFETEYNLYRSNIGAGNKPIFIFTNSFDKIELGETEIYLTHLNYEEIKKIIEDIKYSGFLLEFLKFSKI